MPKTIHLLDSLTIDKIAAGEVIESPASCVKELIDNAIDAGARSLLIEIQLGGRELILIQDDGKGMSPEDLQLSCERHATSKIRTIEDLDSLTSLGFRGEALSSIASISKISIRSRERGETPDSPLGQGCELLIEGGKKQPPHEVTAPFGTQVIVRDIFYNVPARRKFLKPPAKNALDVLKTVKQMALVSPEVSFVLISDRKTVFQVSSTHSLQERMKDILHEPYRSSSIPLHFQKPGFRAEGLLVLPEQAKKNRSGQYLFVNGRPITSLMISCTMKAAYATSLPTDEYPQFALSLHIDPERVDMNVHPQKKEVRFADEDWIKTELYDAVSYALFSLKRPEKPFTAIIPDVSLEAAVPKSSQCASPQFLLAPPRKKNGFFTPTLFEEHANFPAEEQKDERLLHYHAHIEDRNTITSQSSAEQGYRDSEDRDDVHSVLSTRNDPQQIDGRSQPNGEVILLRSLGPYALVIRGGKSIVIIHLAQALHATVSQAFRNNSAPSSQLLLQPEIIELGPLERACLEDQLSAFASLGFSMSQFGKNSLLLESIPSFLDTKTAIACIKELLEEKIENNATLSERVQSRLLQACKRSHSELAEETIDTKMALLIIQNWIKAGEPACTQSGKKVCLSLEHKLLESLFERLP